MSKNKLPPDIEKRFNEIMIEWIKTQWKIEKEYQEGHPYTRMRFEEEADILDKKLKQFLADVLAEERERVAEYIDERFKKYDYISDNPQKNYTADDVDWAARHELLNIKTLLTPKGNK